MITFTNLRLRHMRDYAREVRQFTQDKTRQALDDDLLLERALCYNIGIIGEAASKLLPDEPDSVEDEQ